MDPIRVLLLAGCRPGLDPICTTYGTDYKTLAPVAGVPMILHTLRNLSESRVCSEIIVLAQEPEKLKSALARYQLNNKIRFRRSSNTISTTVLDAWSDLGNSVPLLITTADNCLLQSNHLDDFLKQAVSQRSDMSMGFVTKDSVHTCYPETGRTWIHFNDTALTGCNLFLLKTAQARQAIEFWSAFEKSPKKILRMAWKLGPTFFWHYLKHDLGVNLAFRKISQVMKASVTPIMLQDPAVAIDADKLSDIRQMESIMGYTPAKTASAVPASDRPVVIFDLDRTITCFGTYTPFLVYYARRQHPQKLLYIPLIVAYMIAYKLRVLDRGQLKCRMFELLVGRPSISTLNRVCNAFVDRTFKKGVYKDALDSVRYWKNQGATLVLATASYDWMADVFAAHLGFNSVVATRSITHDDRVIPGIDGDNCYGYNKSRMVRETVGPLNDKQVWFYTDHHSDIPLLEHCSHPVAVNPSRKLKKWIAHVQNAELLEWQNSPTVSGSRQKPAPVFGNPIFRMSLFIASVFLMTTLSSSEILWADDDIPLDKVPPGVMAASTASVPGIVILSAETDYIDTRLTYELEGLAGENYYEIEVTQDGVVLDIEAAGIYEEEERIALHLVPQSVLQAAYISLPGITLFEAEVESRNSTRIYELEGMLDKTRYEIELSAEGKVLEIDKEPAFNGFDYRLSSMYNSLRNLFL